MQPVVRHLFPHPLPGRFFFEIGRINRVLRETSRELGMLSVTGGLEVSVPYPINASNPDPVAVEILRIMVAMGAERWTAYREQMTQPCTDVHGYQPIDGGGRACWRCGMPELPDGPSASEAETTGGS